MWRNTELLVKSHFNLLNPTFRSPSCLLRVRPVIDWLILFSCHVAYFKEVQKSWSCWGLINPNTPVLYIPASALETIQTQGTQMKTVIYTYSVFSFHLIKTAQSFCPSWRGQSVAIRHLHASSLSSVWNRQSALCWKYKVVVVLEKMSV